MDTIDIKIKLSKELGAEEREALRKSRRWIHKVNKGRYDTELMMVVSLPKYFHPTNSYLITKEVEVKEVLVAVKKAITNIPDIKVKIEKATVIRVDYPFTYIMREQYNFNSYRNIMYILGGATDLVRSKNFEDTRSKEKETFYYCDNDHTRKASNKIIIYDQGKKIKDKDLTPDKQDYDLALKDFPELERRMRIEVSLSTNIDINQLKLKKIKKEAYKFLERHLFNDELIENYINEKVKNLVSLMRREGKYLKRGEFIERERPLEYTQVRSAAKYHYDVEASKDKFLKITREVLRIREKRENIIILDCFKIIKDIKLSLKRERMKPTK
ncbi:hypothetical protein PM10SUCC1_32970 [Propionigenium maris DSM 9537]|uniref:Uncharacterized protein n=1 Tax=Propionigenium maris DSM 9537 TaxID=1123000 RepID=A0A9W6LPH9_9FUSO|nr:hypothetical protein [Propionigenium maris]GLI57783.1 hypothetical protein PM10SUCC1_32970 [Propionigenium maris DSM 9537]